MLKWNSAISVGEIALQKHLPKLIGSRFIGSKVKTDDHFSNF
jgi:hypothetical protein